MVRALLALVALLPCCAGLVLPSWGYAQSSVGVPRAALSGVSMGKKKGGKPKGAKLGRENTCARRTRR